MGLDDGNVSWPRGLAKGVSDIVCLVVGRYIRKKVVAHTDLCKALALDSVMYFIVKSS